jgi:hypothetical protein
MLKDRLVTEEEEMRVIVELSLPSSNLPPSKEMVIF